MQTATRAAAQAGGVFILKMRPFEEPHTQPTARRASFASHQYEMVEHPYGVLNTMPRPLGGDFLIRKYKVYSMGMILSSLHHP
jgi:hypothetical protein